MRNIARLLLAPFVLLALYIVFPEWEAFTTLHDEDRR